MDIGAIRRDALVDGRGRRYAEFRRGLTPRWGVVWAELLAGHAALVVTAASLWRIEAESRLAGAALAPLAAVVLAFAFHYLHLFLHEAAHYNLAPDRGRNDLLANLAIGLLIAQDVRTYRPVHFDHHRYLGTPRDTERSYFEPLNTRFLLESLVGVRGVRVLVARARLARGSEPGGPARTGYFTATLPLAVVLHGAVVLGALAAGHPAVAVAWAAALGVGLPFLSSVRQVLEHRSTTADDRVDYTRVPHGAVNRMFGSGPLASVLGGAGFNRHLLHHWDPQVSCTRLAELERFLRDTPFAGVLRAHAARYLDTFRQLYHPG